MPTLEQLLANVRGVSDIPDTTRKHVHSDVFRGAVRQEQSLTRKLNGLVKAVREGKIQKDTALREAEEAVGKHQQILTDIALRKAKRALKKDISVLAPEVTERLGKIREETLKSFQQILTDLP